MRVNTGRRIIGLETHGVTVFALAKLAESRDSDTGAHLERVRNYCRILTERLRQHLKFQSEIDDEFVQLIFETSPLHDIGKVAIPDNILRKPGKLTEAEFAIMKTHTLHGAETLQAALTEFPNARFLQMARDIAISHHEEYNGTGYPNGLAGQEIPLCGRIVALADVYDALTSARPYKEAWSHEAASQYIISQRGQHFDPDVVDAFLAEEPQFIDVMHRLSGEAGWISTGKPNLSKPTEGGDDSSLQPIREGNTTPELPFRALVVDDEVIVQKMAAFSLMREGFRCDAASHVDQANSFLAENEYDLAVVDLRMPNKNGHSLAVDLLSRVDRPVVMIHTSINHPKLTQDLLTRGVDDVVYKPTNYETFAVRAKVLAEARRCRRLTANEVSQTHNGLAESAGEFFGTEPGTTAPSQEPQVEASQGESISRTAQWVYQVIGNNDIDTEVILEKVQREPVLAAEMLEIGRRGRERETARPIPTLRDLIHQRGRNLFGEIALLAAIRCSSGNIDSLGPVLDRLVDSIAVPGDARLSIGSR